MRGRVKETNAMRRKVVGGRFPGYNYNPDTLGETWAVFCVRLTLYPGAAILNTMVGGPSLALAPLSCRVLND